MQLQPSLEDVQVAGQLWACCGAEELCGETGGCGGFFCGRIGGDLGCKESRLGLDGMEVRLCGCGCDGVVVRMGC